MAGPSEAGAPRAGSGSCYVTGGGALEICRSSNEAEGVYAVPPPCRFVHDVQILRLKDTGPPGPLQVIYRAEPPRREGRRGEESCPADLRATDAAAGGAVRIGRQVEALATTLPLADPRFWNEGRAGAGPGAARAAQAASPRRRSRASRQARREARRAEREAGERGKMTFQPQNVAPENDPSGSAMMVAGRDWAGDPYYAILTTATEPAPEGHRRVLVQARTYDFQGLDLRVEADPGTEWKPFGAPPQAEGRRRGRGRPEAQKPAPVLDETGKPIVGNCAAPGLEARGLTGSIAMVDRTYHYFYTDVLPSDCGTAPAKRRMGLYLRTSRDPLAERAWSATVTLIEGLPADTTMRVAKARGMDRWAVAYSCARPVTASGGPVADICLHYTADLSPGSITALSLYSEPVAAGHSSAYLGLRSGGDALGRFTRDGFGWMTDRYGNLDAPAIYPDKGGFLTWLDRRAPRVDGSDASSLYGRPVFWATWTVQPRPAAP